MPSYLFWLFSTVMLIGGTAVIAFRNPVSSALSVVTCFVGLAGLFIGLSAFFVGIIQILVYTGAVMVLAWVRSASRRSCTTGLCASSAVMSWANARQCWGV